ncbi:claudin-10 isoform X2 [Salmo salar]|uniref:Claudin-10 isoform X2 n=1 Tax=Salmo salar TaxID=8030 RepID=A0A1S3MSB9_SALSA|nr:claudin-10 isoform X2 [Salmo salar]|eukprot:XP_014005995.1 PREDICTED: claudin-10-like isoform X2 [Salmo salar]
MKIRVMQIWGFLMTVLGWIFVACTMAMEGWKVTSIGGMGGSAVIKVAWYWSNLWKACFTDSTSVTNCQDFPVLWSVDNHIQIVRGLLMGALSVGMLGFVLSLIGMECTFLGGKDKAKHRKLFTGGVCHIISGKHILSGFLAASGYAVYAKYVSGEYFNPYFDGLKFDLGTPLFLGWVGSAFHMTGGWFYLVSVCKLLCGDKSKTIVIPELPEVERDQAKSTTAQYPVSPITSKIMVSSASKISSKAAHSDVSAISSKSGQSGRASKSERSGRSSKSVQSSKSAGGSFTSGRSSRSRSHGSVDSEVSSGSSSTVSSLSSGSRRRERKPFIKNSYI